MTWGQTPGNTTNTTTMASMRRFVVPDATDDDDDDDDDESSNDYRVSDTQDRLQDYPQRRKPVEAPVNRLWSRSIVHLDVDCFYCQCEEIDGPPDYKQRPLAIGQKHIIVTSNYVARKFGVKKLQSREAALKACPQLLILEGSDLERYRRHSRNIYMAFREGLQQLVVAADKNAESKHRSTATASRNHVLSSGLAVRRGGMDEAFADVTKLVDAMLTSTLATTTPATTTTTPISSSSLLSSATSSWSMTTNKTNNPTEALFVYGDDASQLSSITEDQSGAQVMVGIASHERHHDTFSGGLNAHSNPLFVSDYHSCQQRLHTAASLCDHVRNYIRQQTGFTTSLGISVNPLLAKLASDLRKPKSLNVLYPWRSDTVLLPLPLRKIPGMGSKTIKALEGCLLEHNSDGDDFNSQPPEFWTCR